MDDGAAVLVGKGLALDGLLVDFQAIPRVHVSARGRKTEREDIPDNPTMGGCLTVLVRFEPNIAPFAKLDVWWWAFVGRQACS